MSATKSAPRLTVSKASAGSGKTFQLALNYITLLLGHHQPTSDRWQLFEPTATPRMRHREILAITFTNKATEEMKRRIVSELATLAGVPLMQGATSDYAPLLRERFGLTDADTPRLQQAAATALQELLYDFGGFNVSTIDSFFQTVLRSFAYEADLAGNYELELDNASAIQRGIAETLAQATSKGVSQGSHTARWLQLFMQAKIDSGQKFDLLNNNSSLRSSLAGFVESLSGEDYQTHREATEEFINTPGALETLEQALTHKSRQLRSAIMADAETLVSAPGSEFIEGNLLKYFTACASAPKAPTLAQARKLDNPDARVFVAASNAAAKADRQGYNDFCAGSAWEDIMRLLRKCIDYTTVEIIRAEYYNFGIFSEIERQTRQLTSADNVILLSETNLLLRSIIGDSLSPFVYERTGLRLRHFLIDEFQDTSRLQWANLRPLVLESLDNMNDNLIIGDVKQCIYRFRNSDPDLLGSQLSLDPLLSHRITLKSQDTNYRSARQVVEFNNRLFTTLGTATGNAAVYAEAAQKVTDHAPDGYVDLLGMSGEGEFFETSMARLLDHLERQLDPARGGYRQSDIAILLDTNAEASAVIAHLLDQGRKHPGLEELRVVSDESLLVSASGAVRQVVSYLRSLVDTPQPSTEETRRFTPVSHKQLQWLADEFEKQALGSDDAFAILSSLVDTLRQANASEGDEAAAAMCRRDCDDLRHTDLFNTVEQAIARLSEAQRTTDHAYLAALQDLVLEFATTSTPSLFAFLQWWDATGRHRVISSPPTVDAVRVMTIHKSKGLEFPCVHIPLVSRSLLKEDNVRWYPAADALQQLGIDCQLPPMLPIRSRELLSITPFAEHYEELCAKSVLDNLNKLYVAFTRPQNELIVTMLLPASAAKSTRDELNRGIAVFTALPQSLTDSDGNRSYISGSPTTRRASVKKAKADTPARCAMPDTYTVAMRPDFPINSTITAPSATPRD